MYRAFRRENLSKISMVTALFLWLSLGLPGGLFAANDPTDATTAIAANNSTAATGVQDASTAADVNDLSDAADVNDANDLSDAADANDKNDASAATIDADDRKTADKQASTPATVPVNPQTPEKIKILTPTPATLVKTKTLADGIGYYEMFKVLNDGGMTKINYVKVNPAAPRIEIRPALAGGEAGNLETLSRLSIPYGAIAAINGSFYYPGGQKSPVDTTIVDGKVLVQSPREATSLVITDAKRVYIDKFLPRTTVRIPTKKLIFQVDGINRPCTNGLVVFDSLYGKDEASNGEGSIDLILLRDKSGNLTVSETALDSAVIPANGIVLSFHGSSRDYASYFAVGDKVILSTELNDQGIIHAMANGPLLVTKGCKTLPIRREGLESGLWSRNPRTAVGINAKGEVLLVVVDGRQMDSVGMTFDELADLMLELGAVDAMALDGGGSSQLMVEGEIVNSPSDGQERGISTGIVITNQIPIFINGKRLYFELSEVAPLIDNGRILVPVRKIFEQLGAELTWDDATRTITATKGSSTVVMKIGSKSAKANGKNVTLDAPPRIEDERTIVPLRFVSQAFGGKVEWDAATGSTYITIR